MPTLQLNISPPQNQERCQALAQALTTLTARLLGKRPEVTVVVIEDLPAGRWFVGGQNACKPTALLAIDITQGTNTPAEKAAFVAAAFAELQGQLGGPAGAMEEASYVIVREVPAPDWGYGGITQLARRAVGQPAAGQPPA